MAPRSGTHRRFDNRPSPQPPATTRSLWSAREAAAHLGVDLRTLYTYASREHLARVSLPGRKTPLYAADDVRRLKTRHDARAGHAAAAADAMAFGQPILESAITEIRADGPWYRGRSAVALAAADTPFEAVCDLLWEADPGAREPRPEKLAVPGRHPFARWTVHLALRQEQVAADADWVTEAHRLLPELAALTGTRRAVGGALAEGLLRARGGAGPVAAALINRALVLCADHELNASAFAARVAASAAASLHGCLLAALATFSGPRHGGAPGRVEAWLDALPRTRRRAAIRAELAAGDPPPGLGHPLYPHGDPRAAALLSVAGGGEALEVARILEDEAGAPPNLDFALVALARALDLSPGSAMWIFALGRTAGWVAHALEQRAQGRLLRPRARFKPMR